MARKIEIIEQRKTIFNITSEEAKEYLVSIVADVKAVLECDRFLEATQKVKLPENPTIADYEKLIKKTVPNKIYNFLLLFADDCYDNIRRILSAVFVTDFEIYKKKSLKQMAEDISSLGLSEVAKILSFFRR